LKRYTDESFIGSHCFEFEWIVRVDVKILKPFFISIIA